MRRTIAATILAAAALTALTTAHVGAGQALTAGSAGVNCCKA
ncbi:MAG: hypothetical protein ACJ74O_14965 [Frankiaceae bacterium]